MNHEKRQRALQKIKNQKSFLISNYIEFENEKVPLINFFKNAFINPNRYIAEVQHRVHSLHQYAQEKRLANIFITITLPSQYHPYKSNKNGHTYKNRNYNNIEPKEASKHLSQLFRKALNNRTYYDIPKKDKCYFRVIEPHKSGVPHTHISLFVPEEKKAKVIKMFRSYQKRWKNQIDIQADVDNPVSYLMKYILKGLDDLRGFAPDTEEGLTDLSLWYIYHGITRIFTSRTLIQLGVYRRLAGRYSLLELTEMHQDNKIAIWKDMENNKLALITETEYGSTLWRRSPCLDKGVSFGKRIQKRYYTYTLKSKLKPKPPLSVVIDDKEYLYTKERGLTPYKKAYGEMGNLELLEERLRLKEQGDYDKLYFTEIHLVKRRKLLEDFSPECKQSRLYLMNERRQGEIITIQKE